MAWLVFVLCWLASARAEPSATAPRVRIEAAIDARLRGVSGTITLSGARLPLTDPLSRLPEPEDDLQLFRTYPGRPERGVMHWRPIDDDTWWFYAILPRRYGGVGAIRRFGLFANGMWYPQPIDGRSLPVASWDVTVRVPDGAVGVVGDSVGTGEITWRGRGERVSLAVIPRGQVTDIVEDGLVVKLVTRGRPRSALRRELATQLDAARPSTESWTGAVVEAPLRRRLVRPGVGVAYVSDRAFRVVAPLRRFHRVAVTRGVVQSLLPVDDPFERSIAAAAISARHRQRLSELSASKLLSWTSWVPYVDALLNDRRMPFIGEVLEEVHPADPLPDDLLEIYDPPTPGPVVFAQLADVHGADVATRFGLGLLHGLSIAEAADPLGIDSAWVSSWRRAYPHQDYVLTVERSPPRVVVDRVALPVAQKEAIVVAIDESRRTWIAGPGHDRLVVDLPAAPERVALDPDQHVRQESRLGDRWPSRWQPVLSASMTTLNLTERYVEAVGSMSLRRTYDTHNVWLGTLYTDRENLVGATIGYVRREGRLLDGRLRPHRFGVWGGPAVLTADYGEQEGGRVAIGGGVSYSWDDRVDWTFPLEGERFTVSTDGGVIPGSTEAWATLRASTAGVVSPHPRHAIAGRIALGIGTGDVDNRLLPLGGHDALRSISPNPDSGGFVGDRRVLAMAEYRVAPLRNASIPLGFAWISELQLTAGAEAGAVWWEEATGEAVGGTLGAAVVGEQGGMNPGMIGFVVGVPLVTDGLPDGGPPFQVFLRGEQEF